jgi:ribonuclease BN (tRNA processing enzyme)
MTRAEVLAALAAATSSAALAAPGNAQADAATETQQALKRATGTKLVLLGTGGGPVPGRRRHMTSHVMLHGDAAYVLDCGLGVTDQFARTGIPFGAVRSIFITHHHLDHDVEYGPFLAIGWIRGLRPSVTAYGPPPLTAITQEYLRSEHATMMFHAEDFGLKPLETIATHELTGPGHVMNDENVRVTSVLVQHPPVRPAFGYRFDFPDRSIAFSGDTVPLQAVALMAKGADVLVHEAMYVPAVEAEIRETLARGHGGTYDEFMRHMIADHTKDEDVGRIAAEAGVKTLVLSHLTPSSETVTDETWRAPAARFFKGEIIVGHDLMVI